jgi:acetyl-CoA carboxylase biotin carboxyl carrier protein
VTTTEELLALIDRLEGLLERSGLAEIEVEAGELGIVLRKPGQLMAGAVAVETMPAAGAGQGSAHVEESPRHAASPASVDNEPAADAEPRTHAVLAPLTGIYYAAPSPGAAPYVAVGAEVVAGQVIGLIEAMKLFNEIKSDAAGRVIRMLAVDGALVRAKQPLIEIEPS